MKRPSLMLIVLSLSITAANPAAAQRAVPKRQPPLRGPAARQPDRQGRGAAAQAQRQALEEQLRQRTAAIVKNRLNLSDEQMGRLQETNKRFEEQRRALVEQERQTRVELRQQMKLGAAANQARVGALLDSAMQLQRKRHDLLEGEQKELSTFLTPTQRAQYFALQEQIRKRIEEMRRQQQLGGLPDTSARIPE